MENTSTQGRSVAEELPRQQQRVRELLDLYKGTGAGGAVCVALMEQSLRQAEKAAAASDAVAMIRALIDLQAYEPGYQSEMRNG